MSGPDYQEFEKCDIGAGDGRPDIIIDLSFGRLQDVSGEGRLFNTGQAWSLYQRENAYFLDFRRDGANESYITAKANPDLTKVELACSEEFIDEEGNARNPVIYPFDQILLLHYLNRHDGIIAHCAGMYFKGNIFLFPGCSGAGKSTLSDSLSAWGDVLMLSDDRMIIRKNADSFYAYGTPWPGDAGFAVNRSAPLKAVFFLEKGPENIITNIDTTEAFRRFMPVLSVPWYDGQSVARSLEIISELVSKIPAYVLCFRPGREVFKVIEDYVF